MNETSILSETHDCNHSISIIPAMADRVVWRYYFISDIMSGLNVARKWLSGINVPVRSL